VVQNNVSNPYSIGTFAELRVPEYTEEDISLRPAIFDGIAGPRA
jgi:hypothetical protein